MHPKGIWPPFFEDRHGVNGNHEIAVLGNDVNGVVEYATGKGRRYAILTIDFSLALVAMPLALLLRLGVDDLVSQPALLKDAMLLYAPIAFAVILGSRLDRIPWRYVSLSDAVVLARTAVLLNLIFLAALFLLTRLDAFPRSAIIINTMLVAFLHAGVRLSVRLFLEGQLKGFFRPGPSPAAVNGELVLLIGADDAAEAFIRQCRRDRSGRYRVVATLSIGREAVGTRIHGVEVRGTVADFDTVMDKLTRRNLRPGLVVLASTDIDGTRARDLLKRSQDARVPVKRLPRHTELRRAGERIRIEPLDLEDLLARPEIKLDRDLAQKLIAGKCVAVTGAGGSIGSELSRQIASLGPRRLVLVDSSEFNLYAIDRDLASTGITRSLSLTDVRDGDGIMALFDAEKPDIVYHAAALKHVPLLEANPVHAVRTNVLGTRNVADAAVAAGAMKFVMVSTDKATSPVSIMGATKRIAESYCQALDMESRQNGGTRVMTVRFGNVLGSRGSVVPLFQQQIASGGPITITDEAATRYFMTIREASQLVVQASVMEKIGVEPGSIVVLDMGEPVRIVDLARNLIRLSGLEPDRDIKLEIVGLRPGERLTEDLFDTDEEALPTAHRDLMIARPNISDRALIVRYIDSLGRAALDRDEGEIRRLVARYLIRPAPNASRNTSTREAREPGR